MTSVARRCAVIVLALTLAVTGAPAAIASSVHSAPASKHAKHCGTLTFTLNGYHAKGTVSATRYSCHTARRVLKDSARHGVNNGETLPAPKGWSCIASLGPSPGYTRHYDFSCEHGHHPEYLTHIDFGVLA
jgi:hypothetical protein